MSAIFVLMDIHGHTHSEESTVERIKYRSRWLKDKPCLSRHALGPNIKTTLRTRSYSEGCEVFGNQKYNGKLLGKRKECYFNALFKDVLNRRLKTTYSKFWLFESWAGG